MAEGKISFIFICFWDGLSIFFVLINAQMSHIIYDARINDT